MYNGVNTDGLQVKAGEKSFFWSGKYHNDMNSSDTLVTELNVLADFDPIIPASYQNCEYLMLGNLTPKIQQTVIERLTNRPKLIVTGHNEFLDGDSHGRFKGNFKNGRCIDHKR
jgi:hypothetical protein